MKTSKKKTVEMRGVLPRYPEDTTNFIVEKLREIEPCSIADLVRHLGAEPREGGAPSSDYIRVQEALKRAMQDERVTPGERRGDWRVVGD
jgi:hypothetical protein